MTFTRANPLSWGWLEEFHSAEANHIDVNQSRSLDGFAGGTYNPTAAIVINNQLTVDSTGAAGGNVIGLAVTGKGTSYGGYFVGGGTSGGGLRSIGGTPDGDGILGIGSGAGLGVQGTGGATSGAGVYGLGGAPNGKGVTAQGTGTGTGVYAIGGGAGGIGGEFIGGVAGGHGASGLGVLTGDGLTGIGGATNGRGVTGLGKGTAVGIDGTGGTTSGAGVQGTGGAPNGIGLQGVGTGSGHGVLGTGGATSGYGVHGIGGAPNGTGVKGEGDGNNPGVHGIGGDAAAAPGGYFQGGSSNGIGVLAHANGTGEGVWIKRFTGAHIMLDMSSSAGDPAVPVKGYLWGEDVDDELIYYDGSNKHQLLDTWAHGVITLGVVSWPESNNLDPVNGLVVGANDVTVNFARSFGFATHAVSITMGSVGAGVFYHTTVTTQAPGGFTFRIYDAAGVLVPPNGGALNLTFGIIVKGYFA